MTPEQRKLYNMAYYEANKEKIIEKGCTKVECQFCKRSVIKNNLMKHQLSAICSRKQQALKRESERIKELNQPIGIEDKATLIVLSAYLQKKLEEIGDTKQAVECKID